MAVEITKRPFQSVWVFSVYSDNNKFLCGGYNYNSKASATKGAIAAHAELSKWVSSKKPKPAKAKK